MIGSGQWNKYWTGVSTKYNGCVELRCTGGSLSIFCRLVGWLVGWLLLATPRYFWVPPPDRPRLVGINTD